jgi:hypothetical protein
MSFYKLALKATCLTLLLSSLTIGTSHAQEPPLFPVTKEPVSTQQDTNAGTKYKLPENIQLKKAPTQQDIKQNQITTTTVLKTELSTDPNEQKVNKARDCLIATDNSQTSGEREKCLLTIENAYANNLLKPYYEKTLENWLSTKLKAGDGIGSSWAGIALGTISQYYPPSATTNVSLLSTSPENYNGRDTQTRSTIAALLKSYVSNSSYPLVSRLGAAEGLGYMGKDGAAYITNAIKTIQEHYGTYDQNAFFSDVDSEMAFSLFRGLAYSYVADGDTDSKATILKYMRWGGINNSYAHVTGYPITLAAEAALAAGSYGFIEARDYLKTLAKWHSNGVEYGVGCIPIEIGRAAWELIPKYIRDRENISYPEISTGEAVLNYTITTLAGVRDGLYMILVTDASGGLLVGTLYGSAAAAASSFVAADVGTVIADYYGTTCSYELSLMVARQELGQAFAGTVAGKITNKASEMFSELKASFGEGFNNIKSIAKLTNPKGYLTQLKNGLAEKLENKFALNAVSDEGSPSTKIVNAINDAGSDANITSIKTNTTGDPQSPQIRKTKLGEQVENIECYDSKGVQDLRIKAKAKVTSTTGESATKDIGFVDFKKEGDYLHIKHMGVVDEYQGINVSEDLLKSAINKTIPIKGIKSELFQTNASVFYKNYIKASAPNSTYIKTIDDMLAADPYGASAAEKALEGAKPYLEEDIKSAGGTTVINEGDTSPFAVKDRNALSNTPAYKARIKLGYSKITEIDVTNPRTVSFTTTP